MGNEKVKVYLVYGQNNLLEVISAQVFRTREEAEKFADDYLDTSKIEEREV